MLWQVGLHAIQRNKKGPPCPAAPSNTNKEKKQQPQPPNRPDSNPTRTGLYVALGVILLAAYVLLDQLYFTPKIAYVDTSKLMVGFSEAAEGERRLNAEDKKWRGQVKELEDYSSRTSGLTESLQASIDRMSKEYERAKKKALQDGLSARNQQIDNFCGANMRKMEKLRSTKMKFVMDKENVYLAEYGKKHGYGIIFGTAAGGSIPRRGQVR